MLSKRLSKKILALEREIQRTVYEMLRNGKSQTEIDSAVKRILRTANYSALMRSDLRSASEAVAKNSIAQARNQYGWVLTRTQENQVASALDSQIQLISSNVVRMESKLTQKISRVLVEGIASGRRPNEIRNVLTGITDSTQSLLETLETTARAGFQNTATQAVAISAGVNKFKMVGASPERPFCKKHYGEIKTIEEWAKLDNGQGLPVEVYIGGYNCVHILEPDLE